MRKRFLIFYIFGLSLLLFTGCSEDKLTCTKEDSSNSEEVIATFKDGKLAYLENTSVTAYDSREEAEDQAEFYEMLNETYKENDLDAEYEYDIDGKTLTVTIFVDVEEVEKKALQITPDADTSSTDDSLSSKSTKEDIRNIFEKQGYTCK